MSPTSDYKQGYDDGYERGFAVGRSAARKEVQLLRALLSRRKGARKEQDA